MSITPQNNNLVSPIFSGNVGINTSKSSFALEVVVNPNLVPNQPNIVSTCYGAANPSFTGRRAQGSEVSPSAANINNILSNYSSRGYGTTGWTGAKSFFRLVAAENWSDTANGTYQEWGNTVIGSTTPITRMKLSDVGNLGIGTTNPLSRLSVSENTSTLQAMPSGTVISVSGADTVGGRFVMDGYGNSFTNTFRRANGTAASPTAIINDDVLGAITNFGYGTTGYSSASRVSILFRSAENWTDSAQGTYLSLLTTATGTVTVSEKVRITGEGRLGVGITTPTATIHCKAGTTASSSAPLKLTAGTNMTTPENGAFEFDGTNLYFTVGGVRKTVTLT